MTLTSVLADAMSVLTSFQLYIGIAIAIPLGLRFAGWVKRAVTR